MTLREIIDNGLLFEEGETQKKAEEWLNDTKSDLEKQFPGYEVYYSLANDERFDFFEKTKEFSINEKINYDEKHYHKYNDNEKIILIRYKKDFKKRVVNARAYKIENGSSTVMCSSQGTLTAKELYVRLSEKYGWKKIEKVNRKTIKDLVNLFTKNNLTEKLIKKITPIELDFEESEFKESEELFNNCKLLRRTSSRSKTTNKSDYYLKFNNNYYYLGNLQGFFQKYEKNEDINNNKINNLIQEIVQLNSRKSNIKYYNNLFSKQQDKINKAIYYILENGQIRLNDKIIQVFKSGVNKNHEQGNNMSNGLDGLIITPKGCLLFIEDKSTEKEKVYQNYRALESIKFLPSKIHENNSNIWTVAVLTGNGYVNLLKTDLITDNKHNCKLGDSKWYPGINHNELFDGDKNNWTLAITSENNFRDSLLRDLASKVQIEVKEMIKNKSVLIEEVTEELKRLNPGMVAEEEVNNYQGLKIIEKYIKLYASLVTLKKYIPGASSLLDEINFKLDNTQPKNFKLDNRQIEQQRNKINKFNMDTQALNLQLRKYKSQKKAKEKVSSVETKYFNY